MPSASPRSEPSKLKARLLLVLAFMATAVAYLSGGLEFLEREITDFKFSVTRRQPSADLALVAIDARSLHAMGVWPWPRNLHATLIDRLVAAGARRIAFDVDFSSPSSAEADADLERALEAADGKVVLAAHKQFQRDREGTRLVYTVPLPRFARHAVAATTNVIPDADGLVRRMQVRDRWGDRLVPSLSAYLADAEAGPAETFWVDFAIDPFAIPRFSFSDALAGRFDPEAIDGKTVIVGATAIELGDRLPVPLYKSLSGALLLGLGAESLHQGRALQRIGPAPVLAIVGLLAMLLGPGFFTWSARRALAVTSPLMMCRS